MCSPVPNSIGVRTNATNIEHDSTQAGKPSQQAKLSEHQLLPFTLYSVAWWQSEDETTTTTICYVNRRRRRCNAMRCNACKLARTCETPTPATRQHSCATYSSYYYRNSKFNTSVQLRLCAPPLVSQRFIRQCAMREQCGVELEFDLCNPHAHTHTHTFCSMNYSSFCKFYTHRTLTPDELRGRLGR